MQLSAHIPKQLSKPETTQPFLPHQTPVMQNPKQNLKHFHLENNILRKYLNIQILTLIVVLINRAKCFTTYNHH
jgi:hypothetical protein